MRSKFMCRAAGGTDESGKVIVMPKNKTTIFILKTIIRKNYSETMPNNKNILDI